MLFFCCKKANENVFDIEAHGIGPGRHLETKWTVTHGEADPENRDNSPGWHLQQVGGPFGKSYWSHFTISILMF